ncbi:hypothetical protein BJ508DRAFT_143947 [Ascobolus immersus RN42]|uniref:C2H2-type domain-containing protein n=1 Tax=Ascobolus immersus RN42 TaxID=1160509 RepID=A0A3N4I4M9_ASCIM|nr:hypothetical protein BJ508DRAFT_143947 [Ascobolus immersus RN42]
MTEPNEDRHYMADNVLFQLMERQDSAPEVVEDYTVEELDEAETVAREHQAEQDYESHPEVYETESCPNDIASIHSTGDGSEDAAYDRKQRKHSFKPFVCPLGECGRWFSRADSLKQHMYSHQKESIPKPFLLCHIPGCNRSFSRPDDHKQHLSSHIETQHSAEGPYARTEQALVPRPFDFGPYEDRRDPHQDVAHNVSSSFPVNGEEDDSEALKGYKSRRLPSQPKRGCITCRRRRRQCDEVYPECMLICFWSRMLV